MAESFAMNGGDGIYSYTKNSEHQKKCSISIQGRLQEAINKGFDTVTLASLSGNKFCLVDLGCSVGPNTFFNMKTIIDAIQKKHNISKKLDFHVFFNDRVSNDFNTLFANLSPERRYFAAGVPGSFYDQLFPPSSIHFAYSSYSLPWLTKVPEALLSRSSPAWTGMKIHSLGASPESSAAYSAQYEKDMERFLNARASEIVAGGMMAIITPGVPDGVDPSTIFSAILFDFVEYSLADMVNEGILDENQVQCFNMPIYCPSPKEMISHVERNGCFTIESLELTKPAGAKKNADEPVFGAAESLVMHVRAAFEAVFTKHFGSELTDDIFARTLNKTAALSLRLKSAYMGDTELFLVLKRK
ncbi:hypothetical protein OROMI_016886 [Orobanche minor]